MDDEANIWDEYLPPALQSPSPGLVHSVWKNVAVTTRRPRIHQRYTTLPVISIKHTRTHTHTHAHTLERWSPLHINGEKFNNSSCMVSSFIIFSSDQTSWQSVAPGWKLNTRIVTILRWHDNITRTDAKETQDAYTCVSWWKTLD